MVLQRRAIQVRVDPGQPKVVVYGHIFGAARSAASLVLPKEALGQKYFSMNYYHSPNRDGGNNYIAIVASEANTKVFLRKGGNDIIPGGIILNQGDVYEYLDGGDPTGVEIVTDPVTSACKKIAVFSGSSNSVIGVSGCSPISSDPLYQQNYPVDSWGQTYGVIPLGAGGTGNMVRVLAGEDGTEVRINGLMVATLNAGEYYQPAIPVTMPSLITANKAVAVAQLTLSQGCSGQGAGDPDMVILNPAEYNIRNITVYSSPRENIGLQYLNILIKTAAAPSFLINGVAPTAEFNPMPGAPEYSFAQIGLNGYSTNNFVLSANEGFNAIAYGFGDFESYAYSAGTNLASSQTLSAVRQTTGEELFNACTRENFDFKLVLPQAASSITWQFEDDPPVEQNNVTPTAFVRNGKTLYEYLYPGAYVFDSAGKKNIRVVANYTTGNICNVSQEVIDFTFEVYDPPQAAFDVAVQNCVNVAVTFTDKSTASVKVVSKWLWDFGDGQMSEEQHPAHSFAAPGTYTVTLRVSNDVNCVSDVFTKEITILPFSEAAFNFSDPDCTTNSVVFAAETVAGQADIVKWVWDFGDDSPPTEQRSIAPVRHTFPKVGNYTVKLTVLNSNGCENSIARSVSVFAPSLEAGPNLIIVQGGQIDVKIKSDGNSLTYKWVPSTGLDRDDVKEPVASPDVTTTYRVTISTQEGCMLSDNITVNVVRDIVIPNTFTPNSDGVNDLWEIKELNTNPLVEVNVFNRYGELLFTSVGYNDPWDGRHKGQDVPVGTYYYIVNHKNLGKIISGSVTILR
ncbi:MAG TPA: PKD domain-containing protein [Sphingobacteriaceae bacterium]